MICWSRSVCVSVYISENSSDKGGKLSKKRQKIKEIVLVRGAVSGKPVKVANVYTGGAAEAAGLAAGDIVVTRWSSSQWH